MIYPHPRWSANKDQIARLVSSLNRVRPVTAAAIFIRGKGVAEDLTHLELPETSSREVWKMQRAAMLWQSKPKLEIKMFLHGNTGISQARFSLQLNKYLLLWMPFGYLVLIRYVSPLRNEVCLQLHIIQQKSSPTSIHSSHIVKEDSWLIKRFDSPKATGQNENSRLFHQSWQSCPTAAWSRNVSQTHRMCQLNIFFT